MEWFRLTPESITGIAQIALAGTIAFYIFRIPNKSRVLWLLAFSLLGETIHHSIKFFEFSSPYLYPSISGLLFLPSFAIYVLVITFAYHFKEHVFKKEASIVIPILVTIGTVLSGFVCYVFFSGKPHDEIQGSQFILYATLFYLLLTSSWGIIILIRKALFFARRYKKTPKKNTESYVGHIRYSQPDLLAMRSCIGFAVILSIKIVILLTAVLSEYEVVSTTGRIYANLMLHVVYLCGLTVVIMDHVPHPTSLQAKLIGITLSLALLILSVSALITHSTRSLLERSQSLISDQQEYVFTPTPEGGYDITQQPHLGNSIPYRAVSFDSEENVQVPLPFPFSFNQTTWSTAYVNRNGVIAFGTPFMLQGNDEFYMTQTYHHYAPALNRQLSLHSDLLAPLFIRTKNTDIDSLFIHQDSASITFTWKFIQQDTEGISRYIDSKNRYNSFFVTLFDDGRFTLGHLDINAYLYDGAVGFHLSKANTPQTWFSDPQLSGTLHTTAGSAFLIDNFHQFRTGIHHEVTRMLWILLGSILLIFTLFPLISRTSILTPLQYLRDGSRKIEQGALTTRVPELTRDEIGDVAFHFNRMASSLQEAQQNLIAHNENLEKEVSARTEEVTRQKHQIEIQARELIEMDEIKSRFFANISHEFRTPLNLIMGPVQLALEGKYGKLDPTLKKHHAVILNESERLLRLINQLLDLSKFDAGMLSLNRAPVNLVEVVDRIVRNFSSRASMEQKTVQFHSNHEHLAAPLDQAKLENICYNLIDNAFKFTSAGGKILVSLEAVEREDQPFAHVAVQDTGKGISSEELSTIFDRFQQVDGASTGKYKGTGIGLALVEKLVQLHEGAIEVDSKPGFGTTFNIYLPIPDAREREHVYKHVQAITEETSAQKAPVAHPHLHADSDYASSPSVLEDASYPNVLIVDDDDKFRALLHEYLHEYYRITEATNGAEGLKKAHASPPHIIISDVMMPEMDGIQFCTAVKANPDLDHIPFIILTAKASVESRIEGIEHGADDYLAKPFHPKELHALIKNRLDQRRLLIEKYTELVRLETSEIVVDSAEGAFIKDVMRAIEKNISDNLYSVERLAGDMDVSVRDLQRKLRKILDKTPKDLLLHARIDRAKQLLSQKYGSNQQIARLVGFKRADHFAKVFKKYTGLTPGEFGSKGNDGA